MWGINSTNIPDMIYFLFLVVLGLLCYAVFYGLIAGFFNVFDWMV